MAGPGARGGWSTTLLTDPPLKDVREQLTMRENLELGLGKAQRGIVYAHGEYRNTEHQTHQLQHALVKAEQ